MFGRSIFTLLEEGSHNFPSISSLVDFYSLNLTKPLPCHLTENPILMWFFFAFYRALLLYTPSYKEKNGIIFTKIYLIMFFKKSFFFLSEIRSCSTFWRTFTRLSSWTIFRDFYFIILLTFVFNHIKVLILFLCFQFAQFFFLQFYSFLQFCHYSNYVQIFFFSI